MIGMKPYEIRLLYDLELNPSIEYKTIIKQYFKFFEDKIEKDEALYRLKRILYFLYKIEPIHRVPELGSKLLNPSIQLQMGLGGPLSREGYQSKIELILKALPNFKPKPDKTDKALPEIFVSNEVFKKCLTVLPKDLVLNGKYVGSPKSRFKLVAWYYACKEVGAIKHEQHINAKVELNRALSKFFKVLNMTNKTGSNSIKVEPAQEEFTKELMLILKK